MKLSIVIPVYNEEVLLESVMERVFATAFPVPVEYVLIDDHSRDRSWEIIQRLGARDDVKTFRQPVNQGKGAALRKGFELASGDIIAVHDADLEYDPADLVDLVRPIVAGKADVVYGSRFRRTNPQVHRTFHYLINRTLTLISNVLSGLYVTDMETCYKVFRAEILKALTLESDKFGFEPEVTAKVAKLAVRVHEYPISYFPRTYLEGKKIGWRDGVAALWFMLKFNLSALDARSRERLPAKYLPRRRT